MHNRYKLPFFAVGTLIAAGGIAWAVSTRQWIWVALLGVAVVLGAVSIWTIRAGRYPWWLRSPLDPPPPEDPNGSSSATEH
jgi:hypothetical protein